MARDIARVGVLAGVVASGLLGFGRCSGAIADAWSSVVPWASLRVVDAALGGDVGTGGLTRPPWITGLQARTGPTVEASDHLAVLAIRSDTNAVSTPAREAAYLDPAYREVQKTPSSTTTYYIDSNNGKDGNNGTGPTTAWRTLAKANSAAPAPGDSLLFRRGGDWSGTLTVVASGTDAKPIVVGAYGAGPLPTLRGGKSCVILIGSHLVLSELHADDCQWAGVEVYGSFVQIERCLLTRNAAGIQVHAHSANNRIINNELRSNNRMAVLTRSPSEDDSGAFGVLLEGDATEVADNTIVGCDAFSYDYGRDGAAVEVFGGRDNRIERNLAIDNATFTELGNPRSSNNTYAFNVARSSLSHSTFLITRGAGSNFGPILGTTLLNNTAFLTGGSSEGFVCSDGCGADVLTMRNNIIQAVQKVGYADAPFDEDYDLFWGGATQFAPGPHSLVTAPTFRDKWHGDFRLRASSAAIDHGVDVGATRDFAGVPIPVGIAPDIGAFEYRS